jgi:hypothetical protein
MRILTPVLIAATASGCQSRSFYVSECNYQQRPSGYAYYGPTAMPPGYREYPQRGQYIQAPMERTPVGPRAGWPPPAGIEGGGGQFIPGGGAPVQGVVDPPPPPYAKAPIGGGGGGMPCGDFKPGVLVNGAPKSDPYAPDPQCQQ